MDQPPLLDSGDRYDPTQSDAEVLASIRSMRWAITRIHRELNQNLRPALAAGHVSNVADMRGHEAAMVEWLASAWRMLDLATVEALDRGLAIPRWRSEAADHRPE